MRNGLSWLRHEMSLWMSLTLACLLFNTLTGWVTEFWPSLSLGLGRSQRIVDQVKKSGHSFSNLLGLMTLSQWVICIPWLSVKPWGFRFTDVFLKDANFMQGRQFPLVNKESDSA